MCNDIPVTVPTTGQTTPNRWEFYSFRIALVAALVFGGSIFVQAFLRQTLLQPALLGAAFDTSCNCTIDQYATDGPALQTLSHVVYFSAAVSVVALLAGIALLSHRTRNAPVTN